MDGGFSDFPTAGAGDPGFCGRESIGMALALYRLSGTRLENGMRTRSYDDSRRAHRPPLRSEWRRLRLLSRNDAMGSPRNRVGSSWHGDFVKGRLVECRSAAHSFRRLLRVSAWPAALLRIALFTVAEACHRRQHQHCYIPLVVTVCDGAEIVLSGLDKRVPKSVVSRRRNSGVGIVGRIAPSAPALLN